MSDVKKVLRVGVNNNFNFTKAEIEAVHKLGWEEENIFVNSNSFVTITNDFPSFLTINPYLDAFVEPKGNLEKVKACRIKFIAQANPVTLSAFNQSLRYCVDMGFPILITFMRFCSKESLAKYAEQKALNDYEFRGGYWRLKHDVIDAYADSIKSELVALHGDPTKLHFCDLAGEGCPVCGNCAKLGCDCENTAYELYGVSLAESGNNGECIFHCPDCWAHRIAKYRKFSYGSITQNSKQKGFATRH